MDIPPKSVRENMQSIRFTIRQQHFLAALVLIGMLAFFYRDVVFGGHTFLAEGIAEGTMPAPAIGPFGYEGPRTNNLWDRTALAYLMEPWDKFISTTYQNGVLPLWNPHQGLGVPLHANSQTGMFDPLKLLTIYSAPASLWPFAMDFYLLLRYFLAGFFTYLLLRTIGVGFLGAILPAITFMLCTYFLSYQHIAFIRLDTLLPLTVYAYHKFAVRSSYKAFLLTAFTILWLIVSDFPETLPLHVSLGAIWFLCQRALKLWKSETKLRFAMQSLGQLFLVTLTGALLGAFILVPFVQFMANSFHVHTADRLPNFMMAPWPSEAAWAFLIPQNRLVSSLNIPTTILIAYGIAALLLWRKAESTARSLIPHLLFFVGIALLVILIANRVWIFKWFAELPIINMIYLNRYTQPHILFCLFCASGIGLDLLLSKGLEHKIRIGFVASLLLVVIYIFAVATTSAETLRVVGQLTITKFLLNSLVSLTVFNLFVWISSWRNSGRFMANIFFVVTFLPIQRGNFERPLRYDPYTKPPFVSYLQGIEKPFRIVGTDAIVISNVASAYQLDDMRYIDALLPDHLFKFTKRYLSTTENAPSSCSFCAETRFDGFSAVPVFGKAMDMMNVEYILTVAGHQLQSANTTSFELVHSSVGVDVYRNKNAFPRAFIVHNAEVIPNFDRILDRFGEAEYNPSQTVILDQAPPESFMQSLPAQAMPYTRADVVSRNINDMTVKATLDKPGILVLSEMSYPGWQAFVDGKTAPIYNAYGFMRAVALDVGQHTIEFYYRPPTFLIGLGVAGVTLLLLIGSGVVLYWRKRNTTQQYSLSAVAVHHGEAM